MIRECLPEEREAVVKMIGEGILWRLEEIAAMLHNATAYVYEENGQVQACAMYDLTSFGEDETAEIHLYTQPDSRNRGIGSALFDTIWTKLQDKGLTTVVTTYRVDQQSFRDFFGKRGFQPIWGHHLMKYAGGAEPEPALTVRKFEEQDLAMYIQSQSDAYYEVRKGIDLQPYKLTDYAEKTMESWKNWILHDMREDIYLFYDGEAFVGSLILTSHGEVYDVFVDPLHQGKGFGKQLVHFFVNRTLEKGRQPHLITGTHNDPAIHLYEKTGFRICQTTMTGKRELT